ncbi:MAG TPA: DUF4232 domain-containing protein [Candidatus Eisenbacteria bacterium]|nr:DUF4232 domain-containing protein [Candidatus Eisenbacteria bacterium]
MLARLATTLSVVLLLAACAATRPVGGGSAMPTPVPWLPLEAGPPVFPTSPPTVIPAGTLPCRGSDLVVSYRGTVGIGGGVVGTAIWLGNRSDVACLLSGLPGIRLLNVRGQQIAITYQPITRLPATPVLLAAHTDDVASSNGEPGRAALSVEWQTFDETTQSCPNQAPAAGAIAIRLPGDSTELTVAVGGDVRPLAPCNSRIQVSPFQGFQPPPPPVPHRLVATLSAPAHVRAGERLRYTVTLRNITGEPVTFGSACPSYFESGGMGHQLLGKEGYGLNCHPVEAIPAGGTVTFAMELAVLPSAAPGDNTFRWDLSPDFDADTSTHGSIRVTP